MCWPVQTSTARSSTAAQELRKLDSAVGCAASRATPRLEKGFLECGVCCGRPLLATIKDVNFCRSPSEQHVGSLGVQWASWPQSSSERHSFHLAPSIQELLGKEAAWSPFGYPVQLNYCGCQELTMLFNF